MLQLIWQKIQQWSWLVLALTCWFFAMAFWAATTKTDDVVVLNEKKPAETQQQLQPETISATTDLGMLHDQVHPLNVAQRVITSGQHEAEFRGSKFMKDNQNNWTIELFRVTNEDVIKSFLRAQSNRSNYYYFRLTRPQQTDSYILIYGVYAGQYETESQLKQLQKNWPMQLKPTVQPLQRYLSQVNDLGSDELQSKLQLNLIKLSPVAIPQEINTLEPIPASSVLPEHPIATDTTVVQRDIKGNVVGVEQSKTRVLEPNLKPSNSIEVAKPESRSLQRDGVALPNGNN